MAKITEDSGYAEVKVGRFDDHVFMIEQEEDTIVLTNKQFKELSYLIFLKADELEMDYI